MTKKPSSNNAKSETITALHLDEVKTLKMDLEEERNKATEYLNRLKILQADFENYKRRVEKEITDTVRSGNKRLIIKLLTVLDELEFAIKAGNTTNRKALIEGVKMTFNNLVKILRREGLVQIKTEGASFNPKKHEAVLKVQTKEKDGIILEEVRKGFMLNNEVIRPSLVKVAIDPAKK